MSIDFKVFDKWKTKIGTLSYNQEIDKFFFRYSANFKGFDCSDINTNINREFEQNSLFDIFRLDDSYNKNRFIENYNLSGKSENEIQLFILNLLSDKKELNPKGFYFEKII